MKYSIIIFFVAVFASCASETSETQPIDHSYDMIKSDIAKIDSMMHKPGFNYSEYAKMINAPSNVHYMDSIFHYDDSIAKMGYEQRRRLR